MNQGAKVTSIAALREFRPALIKFIEEARASLTAAETEALRTLEWLRSDRQAHWKREIRLRSDEIVRCKTDLINKQRSATGDPRSAVEERKALDRAKQRVEEAQQKAEHTKRWLRDLEKEHMQYKGMSQSLSTHLARLEDRAVFDLDQMAAALEQYVALVAPSVHEDGFGIGASATPGTTESFAQPDAGGSASSSPYAAFRKATPSAGRRRRAEEIEPDELWMRTNLPRVAAQGQLDAIESLHPPKGDIAGLWATCAPGAMTQSSVYLERCEPAEEWDSGWYIGPFTPGVEPKPDRRELEKVRLADLIGHRPDLARALLLHRGTLIVVEGAAITAITAPNDILAYARVTESQA